SAGRQRLESMLGLGARQRSCKGDERVEEAVGRRQRDLIDEILRWRDVPPIEGSDSPRDPVDKGVQLIVRKCPIDVSVSLRRLAVEVVRPKNDFQRTASTNERREAFGTAASGMHSRPDFDLSQDSILPRSKA